VKPALGLVAALGLLTACAASPQREAGRTFAWEQPPPPPDDGAVVDPEALHRIDFDNGLHAILLEDHRLPRVVLGLTLRRGEGIVPRDEAGLAGFTADLMERGAGGRDALELAEAVEEIGASLSAYADWDEMGVRVSGLSRDLDRLLSVLADVALRPRFDPDEAALLRRQKLAALERAVDDPATLASWWTSRALYPEHRFGEPGSGTPETVARLDAAAARDFHSRVFVPGNAIFSASGDIEAGDLLARAGELFGAWHGADPPPPGPPPPPRTPEARRIVIVDRPDLEQARISLGQEGIARTDPDRLAALLLNSVLGGSGFSSRLMQRVRSDAGLTYGVWSGFALRRQPGPFVVGTFTRVPETRRVIDLLLDELERIQTQPPDAQELLDAQMLAVGEFALALETSDAVVASLVDLDVYGLPDDSLDTYRARVRALTPADTARAARRLLDPQRMALVLVGPAEQLAAQVQDLGPVEVVQP
jgi:zinc protease